MVFGRRHEHGYDDSGYDDAGYGEDSGYAGDANELGPYDSTDFGPELADIAAERLDLGSVILPVPAGGQLQVELDPEGTPQAVHLAIDPGRVTVAAYAAPKSTGQWREVAADLAESLREDGTEVSVAAGPWGREVIAIAPGADLRFIGVDGPRWMLRLVVAGPPGSVVEHSPLLDAARGILEETIVRRGDEPHPVRTPLPVLLPQQLAEQLAAAHRGQMEQQAAEAVTAGADPYGPQADYAQEQMFQQPPQQPRRAAGGSAMQQLGL